MIIRAEHKRQSPRVRFVSPVRFQVRGTPEMQSAACENVSVGGVSFVNQSYVRPSTFLNLELNVCSHVINATGRVAWAQPLPHSDRYRLGIQFIECNPLQKRFLADYVGLQLGS